MFVYTYTHITHTHTFCFCSSLKWVFVLSFPELKLSQPHKGHKGMGGVLCLGWEQTKGAPPQATLWGHIADFHSAMNPHHTNCHRRTALAPSNQHSGRRSG